MKLRSIPQAAVLAALVALVAGGCAGATPTPVVHPVEAAEAPLPAPPPPLPARWVESGGATLIGPSVGDATLVLLGGRRALVGRDGSLRDETAPSPEPLLELIEIPAGEGAGPGRLVGRGEHEVYRFDDPLGAPVALARVSAEIARIGALPGLVAVWTKASDLPRFLDVATGKPRELPGLPRLPLRSVAFLDARRGAAIFEAVGLVTSADGGGSWKPADAATPGDALRMVGLRRRADALRAYSYAEGPEAAVDVAAAKLGAIEPPTTLAQGAPLLRWIQVTGRDPLEAAASGGVDLGARGAFVASHGLLARVDPRSGAILELTELAHGKWMSACAAAAEGAGALIACSLSEDQGGADLFDPFGVLHVSTGEPLRADRPIVIRNGDVELLSSPSGGAMILGSCAPESDGEICVRQSGGKWLPLRPDPDLELAERGAGPLADGRVAFLRGITEDDVGPDAEPDPRAPKGSDDSVKARGLHVAILDAAGHERAVGSIALPAGLTMARVASPIEEDEGHTLHLVLDAGEQLFAVSQPPGQEAAEVKPLAGMSAARIHAGRGIAVGEERVLASPDGGGTWGEIPAPPRVLAALRDVVTGDPGAIAVSAVGVRIGSQLRLGWGAPEPVPAAPPARGAPALDFDPPSASPKVAERALSCATKGASTSAAPLLGSTQIKALFANKSPRKGTRREVSAWSSGRAGMLDTVALLEEEGADQRGSAPTSSTLRWLDPTEIGAKPRSLTRALTGKEASPESTWGGSLRFAAASGARALFTVHASGHSFLVRSKAGGGSETVEIASEIAPLSDVVFGADKGEPIAWMHESDLIVWLAGEAPRRVAQVASRAGRWLGQPSRSAVPMILGGADWALTRSLPIPALDQASAARTTPLAPPSLDGWTPTVNLRRDVGALPACGAKPEGASFRVARSFTSVRVDGIDHSGAISVYDVRVAGESACVAGMSALVSPTPRAAPAAKGAKPSPSKATDAGPVAFVRVDLVGHRAEGGERGPAPAKIRRLACAQDPGVTKQ